MNLPPGGPPNLPTAQDAKLVPYLVARDRFLARFPNNERELIPYYADIGRYVLDRWHAEELERAQGQPLDEQATDCRWDECTEKHLRDLSTEVGIAYREHIRKARVAALFGMWRSRFEPVPGIVRGLGWLLVEAFRGFVGAIGILIFGLAILYLVPSVAKSVRSALDDALPDEKAAATEAPRDQPTLRSKEPPPSGTGNTTGM